MPHANLNVGQLCFPFFFFLKPIDTDYLIIDLEFMMFIEFTHFQVVLQPDKLKFELPAS